MRPAVILFFFLGVSNALPQGILGDIASALGIDQPDPATTSKAAGKTLAPPATAPNAQSTTATQPTSQSPTPTQTGRVITPINSPSASSSNSHTSPTPSSSSSNISSSTITSAPQTSTLTTLTSSTSTASSSSSSTSSSTTTTQAASPPTPIPSQPSSSNGISPGGIAVAVIMTLFILAAAAWLLFRYHPGIRNWWLAREEKKSQERSYRDAIDGPFAHTGGSGVRNGAIGQSRKSMLTSFFAPRTVMLGNGQEIRRKPVNWGAGSDAPPVPPLTPDLHGMAMEKVALTEMAAPMARTESLMSGSSHHSGSTGRNTNISSSNKSSPVVQQKELPPMPIPRMPPVPVVAELHGNEVQRDRNRDRDRDKSGPGAGPKPGPVHGILSRKSIFELA